MVLKRDYFLIQIESKEHIMTDLSLRELCEELSISNATGRNWIKLGKLLPSYTEGRTPYFTREYVAALKREIRSERNTALKSRRNKKFVSGNFFYRSYLSPGSCNIGAVQKLMEAIREENVLADSAAIPSLLADCALKLYADRMGTEPGISFVDYLQTCIRPVHMSDQWENFNHHLHDLIPDIAASVRFCQTHPALFKTLYTYEEREDILGLLYISCRHLGERKNTGSYYTPSVIVRKLMDSLSFAPGRKILDPCCGTGNFLLQLPDSVSFSDIYGNDIDAVSVAIARLNLALRYPEASAEEIRAHISVGDYLKETESGRRKFDHIIGNPPWGYTYSEEERMQLSRRYASASGRNVESCDLFLEQALSDLTENGCVSFVLPEAVLNVRSHTAIRKKILECGSIRSLEYLGNAFDQVQCPAVLLSVTHTGSRFSTVGMQVKDGEHSFEILTERAVSPDCFSFLITDPEYQLLEKLKNPDGKCFLADHAVFALGIVTGNNRKYLLDEPVPGSEPVLRGSDIFRFRAAPAAQYLVFDPDCFQQTAPEERYRAPEKLLYRFICEEPVFAYDNAQTLSLNSCNLLIPQLDGLAIKYILAVLNSSVTRFVYQKTFHSVKVLRSHIESLPIPQAAEEEQHRIIETAEPLILGTADDPEAQYLMLDEMIFDLFKLTEEERLLIEDTAPANPKLTFPGR